MVDGEGRARVVDFGLAHAAHEAATTTSVDGEVPVDRLTVTGALMGTPAYMAPEQFSGAVPDARTDVFAFCVALYEALYAERPFPGESVARLAAAVLGGEVREAPKGARVPPRLRRVLVRGLAVDPDDRYPNMEALLAALDRVVAAPRRRRLLAAGLTIPLVAALAAAALAFDDPAEGCRSASAGGREVWSATARADAVRAFAASELDYADDAWTRADAAIDAWVTGWASARAAACDDALVDHEHSESLLDRRLTCFDRQLSALAEVVDLARDASPAVVQHIGEAVAELPSPAECSPAELLDDGDHPDPPAEAIAGAVAALQRRLSAANTRFRLTVRDADLEVIDGLLAEARALEYRPLIAEIAERSALGHIQLGHVEVSEERFLEAMSAAEASGDTRRLAALAPRWAHFLIVHRSAIAEAEHTCMRTEALLERIGGSDPIRIELHRARAGITSERSYEAAVDDLEAALALAERTYGADDLRLAELHNALGGRLTASDNAGAARHLERARAIYERHLGPSHPRLAFVYRNLGRLESELENYAAAEADIRESLTRFQRLDPDHPNVGSAAHALALVLDYRGDFEEARREYRRALEHLERTLGDEHASTVIARVTLSDAARRVGDLDEALREIERAATAQRRRQGIDNPTAAFAHAKWLRIQLDREDLDAARELGKMLEPIYDESAADPELQWMISVLGMALADLRAAEGRPDEALTFAEMALDVTDDSAHDYARAGARFMVAKMLVATDGDRQRARQLAEAARASWRHWRDYYARDLAELAAWQRRNDLD